MTLSFDDSHQHPPSLPVPEVHFFSWFIRPKSVSALKKSTVMTDLELMRLYIRSPAKLILAVFNVTIHNSLLTWFAHGWDKTVPGYLL
jgi:hypothetical protein